MANRMSKEAEEQGTKAISGNDNNVTKTCPRVILLERTSAGSGGGGSGGGQVNSFNVHSLIYTLARRGHCAAVQFVFATVRAGSSFGPPNERLVRTTIMITFQRERVVRSQQSRFQ